MNGSRIKFNGVLKSPTFFSLVFEQVEFSPRHNVILGHLDLCRILRLPKFFLFLLEKPNHIVLLGDEEVARFDLSE